MVGIKEIGTYIPEHTLGNYDFLDQFGIDSEFIEQKIGVLQVSVKKPEHDTSDLCVKAVHSLRKKNNFNISDVETLIVITQNPDFNLPHTSAIVHGKLSLQEDCACFDISLGCSGYVYGLSVIESFMERNNMSTGILITADPYSKIINPSDKNTKLLFGDAATATLITRDPIVKSGLYNFGTIGKEYENLICRDNELSMNGRAIFNFAARYVPKDIKHLLSKNQEEFESIDSYIFHQGSKYIVDTLIKRLNLNPKHVPFKIHNYGNTVSSSIPLLLESELTSKVIKKIVICGFGVGLSWASTLLTKLY